MEVALQGRLAADLDATFQHPQSGQVGEPPSVGWLVGQRFTICFLFFFSFLRRVEGGDLGGEGQVQVGISGAILPS